MDFFKQWMGQEAIWENTEYEINSALIKRYLIEVLAIDLPLVTILDELKKKESNQHDLALIEYINSKEKELAQLLLSPEYGFKFLATVILNQPSEISLAFIKKIDDETIQNLFHEKNIAFLKKQLLTRLLEKIFVEEKHSTELYETLMKKLNGKGLNDLKINFKEISILFKQNFKEETLRLIGLFDTKVKNFPISTQLKLKIYCLIGIIFTLPFLLIGILTLVTLPLALPFIYNIFSAIKNTYKKINSLSIKNLLHDMLNLASDHPLALFLHNLSPQQLETLSSHFKLADIQKHLPRLLLRANLSGASEEVKENFYYYWQLNSYIKNLLINDKYNLLTQCIDDYFEGKCDQLDSKIILLFEECLAKKNKKQLLSDKEQAFLENIKQEDQLFSEKPLTEIYNFGVDNWGHYRYLRKTGDSITQYLLDRLHSKNQLFGGTTWNNFDFDEEKIQSLLTKNQQEFEEVINCIRENRGLVKVFTNKKNYELTIHQLENPNHREPSLRKPIKESNNLKKFVHMTGEIVPYQKKRRLKESHRYTKKISTTLLSPRLITPLFSSYVGLLFDKNQCQVKALLSRSSNTHQHEWIGPETSVNNYKTMLQNINETDEERFIEKIKTSREVNEVLAKLSTEALCAIVIPNDTPEERLKATQYQYEIKSKFSKHLPILFFNASEKKLRPYTLSDQDNDKDRIPCGNRL